MTLLGIFWAGFLQEVLFSFPPFSFPASFSYSPMFPLSFVPCSGSDGFLRHDLFFFLQILIEKRCYAF